MQAVKANEVCKAERKQFNLATASVTSRFVEPNMAKNEAMAFVNCYHNMYTCCY